MDLTLAGTTLLLGFIRPGANAGSLVIYETRRTRDHVVLAVHTVIELVADPGILVSEVTIQSGTVEGRPRLLCK